VIVQVQRSRCRCCAGVQVAKEQVQMCWCADVVQRWRGAEVLRCNKVQGAGAEVQIWCRGHGWCRGGAEVQVQSEMVQRWLLCWGRLQEVQWWSRADAEQIPRCRGAEQEPRCR